MRRALHILLIALLAATHLWGGCLSCPKFFMFPWEQSASGKTHCCQKGECDGEKDNKFQKECNRVAFDRTPQQSVDVEFAALPLEASPTLLVFFPTPAQTQVLDWADPPPVDRQAILSSFLI